jgi:hypothetical protein
VPSAQGRSTCKKTPFEQRTLLPYLIHSKSATNRQCSLSIISPAEFLCSMQTYSLLIFPSPLVLPVTKN